MKKIICILLTVTLFSTSFIFSAETEKTALKINIVETAKPAPNPPARRDPPPKREDPPPRPHHHRESPGETIIEAFADLFVDIFVDIAFETNRFVVFDDYPYATSDYFIQYKTEEYKPTVNNFSHFEAGGNITYFPTSKTIVSNLCFEGYAYKFFGPFIELTNYYNLNKESDFSDNPYLGKFKIGMDLAFFQTFPFSFSWDFSWAGYYGKAFSTGADLGFTIKSYPFEPIIIVYKLNVTGIDNTAAYITDDSFDSDVGCTSHLEIGAMINNSPCEVYVVWDYLSDGPVQIEENGFGFGVKYHF